MRRTSQSSVCPHLLGRLDPRLNPSLALAILRQEVPHLAARVEEPRKRYGEPLLETSTQTRSMRASTCLASFVSIARTHPRSATLGPAWSPWRTELCRRLRPWT